MCVLAQLGENSSPVRPAELGAAAGADQRRGRLPPAAGAEDGGSQAGGAVPPLLEGELLLCSDLLSEHLNSSVFSGCG